MQSLKNPNHILTVITPSIGRDVLDRLCLSIDMQTVSDRIFHIILWDEKRIDAGIDPMSYNGPNRYSIVLPWGLGRNKNAPGSSLRSIGLMAADTTWVTFADDDVYWDKNHAETMLKSVNGYHWGACLRRMHTSSGEYLGVDRFESIGDSPDRKVPYEMLDNNVMIFNRLLGIHAAQFYRLTTDRNDDRLFYDFMKTHAGPLARTNQVTINHVCPDFLIDFFRENCSKDE